MRELNPEEADCIQRLISDHRLETALVTLLHWADQLIGEQGEQHKRLDDWYTSHNGSPPSFVPGPDDLDDSGLQWSNCSTLGLIAALDQALHSNWQSAGKSLVLVAVAFPGAIRTTLGDPIGEEVEAGAQPSPAVTIDKPLYWLVRRSSLEGRSRGDRMFGQPHFLRHFRRIPRIAHGLLVELHEVDSTLAARLDAVAGSETCYLAHYPDGVGIDWDPSHAGYVLAKQLTDPAGHETAALAHLSASARSTFFVLPECTSPPAIRRAIGSAISSMVDAPLISVTGSWHDDHPMLEPPHLNRCEVLDNRGALICRHVKTTKAHVSVDGEQVYEYIALHNTMHALVTPIGVVGVCICLDLADPNGHRGAAWTALSPQWMLVPSMGDESTVEMHVSAAIELWDTHQTTTMVANQRPKGKGADGALVTGDPQVGAFTRVTTRTPTGNPSTSVRRGFSRSVTNRVVDLSYRG